MYSTSAPAARSRVAGRIEFKCGDALCAPFPMHAFDCVWVQHVLSSLTDKARLFSELRRVLTPTGVLALHEIVSLDSRALRYPLPWARSPLTHFPATARRLRTAIESAGFMLRLWRAALATMLPEPGPRCSGPTRASCSTTSSSIPTRVGSAWRSRYSIARPDPRVSLTS
jgi:SAM-dependent methyltransferase